MAIIISRLPDVEEVEVVHAEDGSRVEVDQGWVVGDPDDPGGL